MGVLDSKEELMERDRGWEKEKGGQENHLWGKKIKAGQSRK